MKTFEEKLISVIVPVYNKEKYFDRCIRSIVDQTYEKIEIILIDDGSPDKCGIICDEWAKKDERIKVIHQYNQGVSVARNNGLSVATGEYVMFVDADDWLDLKACEILVANSDEKDFIMGSYSIYSSDEVLMKAYHIPACNGDFSVFFDNIESYLDTVFTSSLGRLFRNELIQQRHIMFNENKSLLEDKEFVCEYLSYVNSVCVIDCSVVNVRVVENSLCRSFRKDEYDCHLSGCECVAKMCLVHGVDNTGYIVLRSRCVAFVTFVCTIWRCESKDEAIFLIKKAATCKENVDAYNNMHGLPFKYLFLKWLFVNEMYGTIYYLSKLKNWLSHLRAVAL